jgi:hypothetical protein
MFYLEDAAAKLSVRTIAMAFDMASSANLFPSRRRFFMNKPRKLGLIDYNGHLEVHSSLLNFVLHDDPHSNR